MYLISAEGYKNGGVQFLRVRETGEIWGSMKDARSGMGVKSISDLVLKEINRICETEKTTKEQVSECKMTKTEIYEKLN